MIRHRWYLAPAARDKVTGRRQCLLQSLAGEGTYAWTIYAADDSSALVRVTQEDTVLDKMEAMQPFIDAGCICLRVNDKWSDSAAKAPVPPDDMLAKFGIDARTVPDTLPVADMVNTLLMTKLGVDATRGDAFPTDYLTYIGMED